MKKYKSYRILKTIRIDGILLAKGSIVRFKPSVAKGHLIEGKIKPYKRIKKLKS